MFFEEMLDCSEIEYCQTTSSDILIHLRHIVERCLLNDIK